MNGRLESIAELVEKINDKLLKLSREIDLVRIEERSLIDHVKELQEQIERLKAGNMKCKTCDGTGLVEDYYDPSPSGVSLGSGYMVDYEWCPDCTAKRICPNCGQKAKEVDDVLICDSCGFKLELYC